MPANADLGTSALLESDSELRELVRSILGGHTRGDSYLDDVFSICRRKPQSAGILREIIDRHQRLGRMPRSQHRKIQMRIDQARPRGAHSKTNSSRADAERFEDPTCDLTAEPIAAAARGVSHANTTPRPKSADINVNSAQSNSSFAKGSPARSPDPNSVRRERERAAGLIDSNPTVESPPPPPRSGSLPRGMPAAVAERADLVVERTVLLTGRNERIAEIAAIVAENSHLLAERLETQQLPPLKKSPFISALSAGHTEVLMPPAREPPVAAPPPPAAAAVPPPAASAAEAIDPAQSGARLKLTDRYELQVLLGRGGMASVYRAVDRERERLGVADRFVALKVVTKDPSQPGRAAALLQEFQSAQRLSHPNIINVYDIDQVEDATFYSMELLSGARLSQAVLRVDGARLERRYALAIIRDIGAAISHAHSRGVVHADLKPSNVMITLQNEVRVLDFGGSSMPPREPWISDGDADDAFHQATPAFASCEQLERGRADPRDDIYALACIAYLLLAGRHPFDHLSSIEARRRGLEPKRPSGMPGSQWRALRHGLMFERSSQPESMDAWLASLGLKGAAARLPPLQDLTAPEESQQTGLRAGLMAAAALVVTVGTWAVLSNAAPDWEQTLNAALTSAWGSVHDTFASINSMTATAPTDALPASAPTAAIAPTVITPAPPAPARTHSSTPRTPAADVAIAPAIAVVPAAQAAAPAAAPATTAVASAIVDSVPHVAFTAQHYVVGPGDPAARIIIQREVGSEGDLNFIWWTEGGTAEPDVDYAPLGARTERLVNGQDKLTVYVPIISNPQRTPGAQFRVALVDAASHRGEGGAPSAHATVTIEGGR
jgi:serine/threonine protein kinase